MISIQRAWRVICQRLIVRDIHVDYFCSLINCLKWPGLFMDKFVSADTDQSPQIHLDLEQTVTEYYSFPRSKVLNGQEEKDGVLTL